MNKNISYYDITEEQFYQCAEKYGTPCYIYNLKFMINQWGKLKSILPFGADLCYSLKANPNEEIIKTLNSIGSHFEVASVNEIITSLKVGVKSEHIYYVAPAKSLCDIEKAIDFKIKAIVVDSSQELKKIMKFCKDKNKTQNIMFRLNTGQRSAGSLSMSGITQFGMSKEEIIKNWEEVMSSSNQVKCIGLHCYQGTNILDETNLINEFKHILEEYYDICKTLGQSPLILDLGGGFGNPLSKKDKCLDLIKLKTGMLNLFSSWKEVFKSTKFVFESGRFIVGSAGHFLTRVVDVKQLHNKKYVFVDGGIHCYGGLSRTSAFRHPPIRVLNNEPKIETITICGPSCTPLDIIAIDINLQKSKEGDLLIVDNAGSYQFSASPGKFLSFGFPKEVCLK